jgi:hypothetical protein
MTENGQLSTTVPDVLHLRLLRLAACSIWQEPDFVRGWFITLWVRLATNELEPGYLRVAATEIYRAAGARSREYFERHAARMLEQNFQRDDEGRLYCPRLLQELKDSRV